MAKRPSRNEIHCPICQRFLVETEGTARIVCPKCGTECEVTPKSDRVLTTVQQRAIN